MTHMGNSRILAFPLESGLLFDQLLF